MLPALRQQEIVDRLADEGFVTVGDLAEALAVDGSTVRRDLADLARDGLIRRVRGGALPPTAGRTARRSAAVESRQPRDLVHERTDGHRPWILASLTAADPAALGEAAERLVAAGVNGLHLDIADGAFVPYLTFGPRLVAALRRTLPAVLLDVHLMVEAPEAYADDLARGGADRVTFHVEATRYPWRVVTVFRRSGIPVVGVALNPATPVEAIDALRGTVPLVNALSTEPDLAGEAFLASSTDRLRTLRARQGPEARLVVDGGIDEHNVGLAVAAGATDIVVGRSITGADDWSAAVERLRAAAVRAA